MDKYVKKELIGLGSCGNRVYKVISTEDKISILQNISHEFIIKYSDSFIIKDKLYIITEFAEGGDLKTFIKCKLKQPEFIEESKLWIWVYQLSLAINFLHSNKIIHRDIKAENVFLTKEMHIKKYFKEKKIKLGDFGISKALDSPFDFAETGIGTPFFLSPEICKGEKYNFKTDIWMLGCLIYELCFLKRPFEGESISMIMIQIIKTFPEFTTEFHSYSYSSALITLLTRCLNKNPDERPNIEEILLLAQKQIENFRGVSQENRERKSDFNPINQRNSKNAAANRRKKNQSLDSNANNNSKNEKLKLQIEVDEEENEVHDLKYNMIFVDQAEKNHFSNYKNSNECEVYNNTRENLQHNLNSGLKAINFNSKIFVQKSDELNNSATYSQKEPYVYTKYKNSTPSYCKEDVRKILKKMKISPVNNPGISSNTNLIPDLNNNNNYNEQFNQSNANSFVKNSFSDNALKNILGKDSIAKLDLFRKSSVTTTNSVSTSNSLQSDQTSNLNVNNTSNNKFEKSAYYYNNESINELSLNLNKKNLNNNSGKIFISNTTKNNAVSLKKINFNFNTKATETSNFCYSNNNSNPGSQNLPTPDSTKMQHFRNITDQASGLSKAKDNLNKLNELKKGHLKTISINISSVQSPEHNAVYEIEKIEQCENIGFPKLDWNLRSQFSFTPTNMPLIPKGRIIEALSPRKIRVLPKSTKVGSAVSHKDANLESNSHNENYNNKSKKYDLGKNECFDDNRINVNFIDDNQNRSFNSSLNKQETSGDKQGEETLIVKFLIEKYGIDKYLLLKSTVKRNDFYNCCNPESKEFFIDEDKIKKIVGEEEYKIAINYMKYFKP